MDVQYGRYSKDSADYQALAALLEAWPDPALAVDASGHAVVVNSRAEEFLGWSLTLLDGKPLHDLLCSRSRELGHDLESCPFNSHAFCHQEWHSSFWCSASGNFLSVDVRRTELKGEHAGIGIWSCIDNRDHQHNQAELAKFAQFVSLSPAPIAEFDDSGQLLFANEAMQDAMLEAGFTDDGQPAVLPADMEVLCEACASKHEAPRGSFVVETHDLIWEWRFHPLQADNVMTVIGFAFDITAQQTAQKELEEAQAASRRDFYAKMIHELRTPLNAIMGFSDLLLKRAGQKLADRERAHLQIIKNAGFQLNELVTDTLDISKIEAGYMEVCTDDFQFADIAALVLPQLEGMALSKGLVLHQQVAANICMHSDLQKIRQIVVNLLSNAIKYTPEGEVIFNAAADGDNLIITVKDTGVGIPPEQLDKLFRSYQQIKEERNAGIRGTGLGLALVEELVVMLGGRISVDSEYKKGSTFSVVLPLRLAE